MYMKKIVLLLVGFISLFGSNASAQETQPSKKQKKEIIIHEGSDSSQKMVVIVNGDKVTVNGKEYNGDEKNELFEDAIKKYYKFLIFYISI